MRAVKHSSNDRIPEPRSHIPKIKLKMHSVQDLKGSEARMFQLGESI